MVFVDEVSGLVVAAWAVRVCPHGACDGRVLPYACALCDVRPSGSQEMPMSIQKSGNEDEISRAGQLAHQTGSAAPNYDIRSATDVSDTTDTTSMNHFSARSGSWIETGKKAVRAGLPVTKVSGDQTAQLVQRHLSPALGSVAMGGDQVRQDRYILTFRSTEEDAKCVVLIGGCAMPPALCANAVSAKSSGVQVYDQLVQQGHRPCVSTEFAVKGEPLRSVVCGDFNLKVIELPKRYSLRNAEVVSVAKFVGLVSPDSNDPAGLRAAVRAALFGATEPEAWRGIFDDAPSTPALQGHLEKATADSLQQLLTSLRAVSVVLDDTVPDDSKIYALGNTAAVK